MSVASSRGIAVFTRSKRAFIDTRPKFVNREPDPNDPYCECGNQYPRKRLDDLGINSCLQCSDEKPRVANMAMHKQAMTYTANVDVVKENQYMPH